MRGQMAPSIEASDIIYQEWFASGHSWKNTLTRLGGARNCLRLVVTKDLLWVTSWFPFSLFMGFYDLEHVVPRGQVISIRRSQGFLKSSVILTFQDADGAEHTLSLYPRRQAEFLRSLGGETSTTEAERGTAPDRPRE
jgi:hypothetical protein